MKAATALRKSSAHGTTARSESQPASLKNMCRFFHCMLLCVTSFSSTVWSVHFALLPSSRDIFRLNLTPFDGLSKRGNKHEYCGFKCVALNNDAA